MFKQLGRMIVKAAGKAMEAIRAMSMGQEVDMKAFQTYRKGKGKGKGKGQTGLDMARSRGYIR